MKHPKDMNEGELRELVFAMSQAALDLSQHLNFTNDWLKDEYKQNAYKRAEDMAGAICQMPYRDAKPDNKFQVVLFGENGLERLDT